MKKYIKTLGTCTMALALGLSLAACKDNSDEELNDVPQEQIGNIGSSLSSDSKLFKEETVYAFCNADGSVNGVTVSDWLKNNGQATLTDVSNLTNIKNLKGDEVYQDGSWNANGNDIYYQGTGDKNTLPVSLNISYELDGASITPTDLHGKSGNLEMTFNYSSTLNETYGVYYPFLMISGFILDNAVASNVEVSNGKIINDGNRSIIVGYGVPGVVESLGVKEGFFDLAPTSFTVSAKVTNFELSSTATVALNSFFEDSTLNISSSGVSEEELMQASQALLNEVGGVLTNAPAYKQEVTEYLALIQQQLIPGITSLYQGLNTLYGYYTNLSTSLAQLQTVAQQAVAGIDGYDDANGTHHTGLKEYVYDCYMNDKKLDDYLTANQAKLCTDEDSIAEYKAQITALRTNEVMEQGMLDQLTASEEGNSTLYDALVGLTKIKDAKDGLDTLNTNLYAAVNGYDDADGTHHAGLKDIYDLLSSEEFATKLNSLSASLIDIFDKLDKCTADYANLVQAAGVTPDVALQKLAAMYKLGSSYTNYSGIDQNMDGSVKFIFTTKAI